MPTGGNTTGGPTRTPGSAAGAARSAGIGGIAHVCWAGRLSFATVLHPVLFERVVGSPRGLGEVGEVRVLRVPEGQDVATASAVQPAGYDRAREPALPAPVVGVWRVSSGSSWISHAVPWSTGHPFGPRCTGRFDRVCRYTASSTARSFSMGGRLLARITFTSCTTPHCLQSSPCSIDFPVIMMGFPCLES